jgi:hypothetical protein
MTKTDWKLFIGFTSFIIGILVIGVVSSTALQKTIEESFNLCKLFGGVIVAIVLLKNWSANKRIFRTALLTFCLGMVILCSYHFYCIVLKREIIDYLINLTFHLIVIVLYIGLVDCVTANDKEK